MRSRSPTSRRRGCSPRTRTARTASTTSPQTVEERTHGKLPADHILIASDHTHSGPDTIGAWGGVSNEYLQYIHDQTVDAIVTAFNKRRAANVRAGHSDASDLIYNQSCSEALNQDRDPTYPGPEVCVTKGKDGMVRVVQATDAKKGTVIATFMAYAAHATAGGGDGLHGDWPQFLSDKMTAQYGGVGLAMVGALGGTQPCRHACSFTKKSNPGIRGRHPAQGSDRHELLRPRREVARRGQARERPGGRGQDLHPRADHGPGGAGTVHGWQLRRCAPSALAAEPVGGRQHDPHGRVDATSGRCALRGTPGEGFPKIGELIRKQVTNEQEAIQLGLANDQLGYLIAPVHYVPVIAAEAPVNDNIIFNVSPTIGDHVMCADLRLALELGFKGTQHPKCPGYDAADSAGDPAAQVPLGGVPDPVAK